MSSNGRTYVITGANRGLGLEFVRQLLSKPGNTIIAGVRSLEGELDSLLALAKEQAEEKSSTPSQIYVLACDTSSESSIAAFGKSVASALADATGSSSSSSPARLNYLLNNAGINAVPSQTALDLKADDLQQHITTNVFGPAKLVQVLLPHLGRGSVVMNMSSGLGSSGKGIVRCASYAISKAALGMLTVHQAGELEERGVSCVAMDPGWVKTRMGGEGAVLEAEDSISGMLKVLWGLDGVNLGGKAKFIQHDGEEVPW